jgi:iron complex outermembrane receptor protein
MNVSRSAKFRLAAVLGVACAATAVQAAEQLEEVVVTAQKRAQGVNDVGITVNTFTAEALADHGVRTPADLEVLTPALTVTETAPTGVPVYTIRGVGFADFSTASSSTVGLYFDEASIPYAVMSRGVLFDIERVEVLKGPQGDLYGRNTTAGQINFISRRPTPEFSAGATLGYSRFNVFDFEGYLSGPILEGVQARLAAKFVTSDAGWQQSISRPGDTLGQRDERAVRALFDIRLGDAGSLLLNLHWTRDLGENQAPTAYDGTLIGRAPQPLPTAFDATPYFSVDNARAADWSADQRPKRNDTLKGASARLDWSLAPSLNLTSVTAYDKFDRMDRFELSGLPFQDGVTDNGTDASVFSQELRLSSAGDPKLYWLGGVYYSHDRLSELYDMYMRDSFFGFALGIKNIDTRYQQTTDSIAGFGHVEWKFADRLQLTGGLRYTSEERKWSGCTYDIGDGSLAFGWNNILTPFTILANGLPDPGLLQPGGCGIYDDILGTPDYGHFAVFHDKITTRKWMGKLTLDFKPTEGVLLYGTVSSGFKSGGFNGAAAQTHSQLLPYKPETLTSFELGTKSTLLNRHLQLNVAAFYYDYRDKQEPTLAVTPVGNIAGLTNVPKSEVWGGELEARWLVTQGLTLDLGVSYLRTKIKEYMAIDATSVWPNIVRFDASGSNLANAPKLQANAAATYEWRLNQRLDMFVGADYSHKDAISGRTQDPVSSYDLLNARVGVKSPDDRWSATLWGRNLTDEYYWTAAFGSNGTWVRMNGMPRTYGVTFTLRR